MTSHPIRKTADAPAVVSAVIPEGRVSTSPLAFNDSRTSSGMRRPALCLPFAESAVSHCFSSSDSGASLGMAVVSSGGRVSIVPSAADVDKHVARRAPRKNPGFSWGRYPSARGGLPATHVEWRLFRRDHTGRLHFAYRAFAFDTPREHIAAVLLAARRQLREAVDEIDLAALMQAVA